MNDSPNNVDVLEAPSPQQIAASTSHRGAVLRWLGRALPTLLVLATLGALAYWGHHTGWKLPKFSTLSGEGQAERDDWCSEHDVPESQCVECDPKLLPGPDYGWCKKHGVQNCPLCHPDVAQVDGKPQISPADRERAERALGVVKRPENNPKCPLYRRRIQFASAEDATKAGVDVAVVQEGRMLDVVATNGEITYDPTRVVRLSVPVPGKVWRVERQIGQPVLKGDALALVDAVEVGKAKAEFLQAVAQLDLRRKTVGSMKPAVSQGAIPEARYREAEAALREAEIRLLGAEQALVNLGLPLRAEDVKGLAATEIARQVQFLGLPEAVTKTLDPKTTTANLIPVKAPFDGVVVACEAVAGEVVDTTKTLFVVADTSRMWLTLNVRQEDAKYLALGQPVRFRAAGGTGDVTGKLTWMDRAVDEKTRTVKVRADLPNAEGRLLAHTFGAGQIVLRDDPQAIVVPNEAVQWDGSCHVVFVRDKNYFAKGAPKVFHTRTVRPGAKDEELTEIVVGVLPGEVVASRGSGVLRAQLLKNNLGAG